jgi:hypothetical protein
MMLRILKQIVTGQRGWVRDEIRAANSRRRAAEAKDYSLDETWEMADQVSKR